MLYLTVVLNSLFSNQAETSPAVGKILEGKESDRKHYPNAKNP
jgi:hypothetical protein